MQKLPARRSWAGRPLSAARLLTFVVGATFPAAGVFGADAPRTCSEGRLRVAVDIGHSRAHPGATSARRAPEYIFNARFAKELVAKSKHASPSGSSLDLFIHNPGGADVDLYSRPRNARRMGAHVFVSIHHDFVQDRHLVWRAVDGVSAQQTPAIRVLLHLRIPPQSILRREPSSRVANRSKFHGRADEADSAPCREHFRRAAQTPGSRGGTLRSPVCRHCVSHHPAVLVEVGVIATRRKSGIRHAREFGCELQLRDPGGVIRLLRRASSSLAAADLSVVGRPSSGSVQDESSGGRRAPTFLLECTPFRPTG